MRPRLTMVLLLLFFASSLNACAPEKPEPILITQLQTEQASLPPAKLRCPTPRPRVPDPKTATQVSVAAFLEEYEAWGDGCDDRWREVRELLRPAQK